MFQISASPTRRNTASALTVLAAMGASGMVASVAEAAPIELEPTEAVITPNSSYAYLQGNWQNWLEKQGSTLIGGTAHAFVDWDIDFGAGAITSAAFKMNPINTSVAYGIPVGAPVHFELITDAWSAAAPKPYPDPDGPDVGTALGTEAVTVLAPGGDFDADITSLVQHWQANPLAYHGIRISVEAQRGGVYAPNDAKDGSGRMANLVLEQAVPEPASLGLLAVGSLLALRRRR